MQQVGLFAASGLRACHGLARAGVSCLRSPEAADFTSSSYTLASPSALAAECSTSRHCDLAPLRSAASACIGPRCRCSACSQASKDLPSFATSFSALHPSSIALPSILLADRAKAPTHPLGCRPCTSSPSFAAAAAAGACSAGAFSRAAGLAPATSSSSSCSSLQRRSYASSQPENTVYSGPSSPSPSRVTLRTLRKKYEQRQPITMLTAYDYPSAVHVDQAQADILLVGDSVAMVVHGHDTTLPITVDDMLTHCRAVARGARRAFLLGDMPFGSYETGVRDAVASAVRLLKEGGMDAVKLEGGSPARVEAARAIVEAGVAVMGHVGLTPQSVSVIGGFRPQAQVADEALRVLQQAQALQAAGCFGIVLECIPGPIAAAITASLNIPTIGIGAGPACSGQVLVYHDLLGMMSHPHHAKVTPKFCKQYARVGDIIQGALTQYCQEVTDGTFPGTRFSPYKIAGEEVEALCRELQARGMASAAGAVEDHMHSMLSALPPASS